MIKILITMMILGGLVQNSSAADGERKLPWSRATIAMHRENFVRMIKRHLNEVKNPKRALGQGKNDWEDCWKIFNHAKRMGWMTQADVDDWVSQEAAPEFDVHGNFMKAVEKQCGCFHPGSLIDVFDPIAGKKMELSAANVVERRGEIALIHLDREATADNFVGTYSPIRITTHGREFFDLVVIGVADGRSLRLTRGHGVFVFPGVVKQARDVTVEDKLYNRDGSLISVVSLGSESIEDEVVNFETFPGAVRGDKDENEDHPLEHIIFASGLAVGDLSWQNRLGTQLGQMLW